VAKLSPAKTINSKKKSKRSVKSQKLIMKKKSKSLLICLTSKSLNGCMQCANAAEKFQAFYHQEHHLPV
jgi:hypothetical protein